MREYKNLHVEKNRYILLKNAAWPEMQPGAILWKFGVKISGDYEESKNDTSGVCLFFDSCCICGRRTDG